MHGLPNGQRSTVPGFQEAQLRRPRHAAQRPRTRDGILTAVTALQTQVANALPAGGSGSEVAEEAPNRPSDDEEEEEVSDEALAAVEARLQARMDASARGAEDIESAPASSAPTATVSLEPTVSLDPLEEDEDEPTFQSRLPTLKSIPYADDAYGSLAPHAATAWQKVTEGVAMARVHTKEYEQTVAETIAPLSAAVAPHVSAGRALLARVLQVRVRVRVGLGLGRLGFGLGCYPYP